MATKVDTPRPQDAMAALLGALGFAAMARDVVDENDPARLVRYVNVILRNTGDPAKRSLILRSFRALGVVS